MEHPKLGDSTLSDDEVNMVYGVEAHLFDNINDSFAHVIYQKHLTWLY